MLKYPNNHFKAFTLCNKLNYEDSYTITVCSRHAPKQPYDRMHPLCIKFVLFVLHSPSWKEESGAKKCRVNNLIYTLQPEHFCNLHCIHKMWLCLWHRIFRFVPMLRGNSSSNGSGWVPLRPGFILRHGLKSIRDFYVHLATCVALREFHFTCHLMSIEGWKTKSLVWPWPKSMPDIFMSVWPRAFLCALHSLRNFHVRTRKEGGGGWLLALA